MSESDHFQQRAAAKAADLRHAAVLKKAIGTYTDKVCERKDRQWRDWGAARHQAARLKDYVLENLPRLLDTWEQRLTARGAKVLWAEDAEEARRLVLEVVQRRQAKRVVKSKSMLTEEIELNEALALAGVEVCETDLGEFIVQLAGQKPYHLITPAMHFSRGDVAALFAEKLGAPVNDQTSAEELTLVARAHLRDKYLTAAIGITGANFLIAEEGAIALVENEGNGRLSMACPPVHIVVAGLERVIPRLADLPFFLPLLATSGTGQELSNYNSIVRGPRQPGESDGPEEMIVIVVDNGRSRLYRKSHLRLALRCLRCGACLNACPVYRTIGGHAYGCPYQGPIGSLLTPQFRGQQDWQHLGTACSLCGACTSVCPAEIPLHELLLESRDEADRQGCNGAFWRQALHVWAWACGRRWRLELGRQLCRGTSRWLLPRLPEAIRRRVPPLPARSFAQRWRDEGRE